MKSSSYKLAGTLLCALALALFGAWIFVLWQSASLRQKVSVASAEASETSAKEQYLLTLKKALIDARDSADQLDARFVGEDDVPAFIDMLETRLASSGAKADLGSIALDDASEGSRVRALRLHVTASGTWREAVALISSLESMKKLLSIRTLSLSSSKNSAGAASWSVSADLIQYVLSKQK